MNRVAGSPVWQMHLSGMLLVPGFPCGVLCTLEARRIIISGGMDLRQDSEIIRRRLRGRNAYAVRTPTVRRTLAHSA